MISKKYKQIRLFLKENNHLVSPVAIIGGFVVDIFTLNQIDQIFDNAILVAHIIIVGLMIALLFAKDTPWGRNFGIRDRSGVITTVMMFSFGGLFSGFFLFYIRSGSFLASAPFIIMMLALMLGAEFLKHYYQKIALQITIYYIAIFAYLIFFIPLLINVVNAGMFIASGLTSLLVIVGFLYVLFKINPDEFKMYKQKLGIGIGMVFVIFNGLYFTNIIPPVPLALKFNSVYHSVEKIDTFAYEASYEPAKWYQIFRKRSARVHWVSGEPVYVFTSIFAPTKLTTTIEHRWDYFDSDIGKWITRTTVPIDVTGGRDNGFRGYSFKKTLEPGSWRVAVTNRRGQVLGFVRFKIIQSKTMPELVLEKL